MAEKSRTFFPPSLKAVQLKAQERWKNEGLFFSIVDPQKANNKAFVTIPMPYTDSLMSLNRAYTIMTADIMIGYQQMKGKNVLLPLFFHYGGTRIQVFFEISIVFHYFFRQEQIISLKNYWAILKPYRGVSWKVVVLQMNRILENDIKMKTLKQ